ncbi:alpha/beta fold hydrolase [Xanthomonas citri pv. citri]|uniref:esterase/lipase family protein n=1 Tax=Xanthomonas citri TaxID=346 RepID=UPI0017486BB8|nr:alpha/beta fold hydrolase [Xanthomonas citri]MBD4858753.1 alpha/beta fold hydrolase [Xanthomonas citri pv. citri]QYF33893.1 alpha/beta fold hydrolase [Xanthomonas citri pv. citri]
MTRLLLLVNRCRLACLLLLLVVMTTSGCAAVTLKPVKPRAYLEARRGDALTTGRLSDSTIESLRLLGLDSTGCLKDHRKCVEALLQEGALTSERGLSAAAEVSLLQSLKRERNTGEIMPDATLSGWLETARYAYAYLFFSGRSPDKRAFEDGQTQVRDYYNYATEQVVAGLFQRYRQVMPEGDTSTRLPAPRPWQVGLDVSGLGPMEQIPMPQALIPASKIHFKGLRSVYRRDGFGTEMVAVLPNLEHGVAAAANAMVTTGGFSEMHTPNITAVLRFEGDALERVLTTSHVTLEGYDPLQSGSAQFGGHEVPLAANYTAGYGVWLAGSGFAGQSLRTLFGMAEGLNEPRLFMLQPYDPNRRVLLLMHGLGSSPEAWVNLANEIVGDAALRQRYQIWMMYYPTNLPLPYNHIAIRRTVEEALNVLDPARSNPASHHMVLVGHSMGGVLARLMISSSAGDRLWHRLFGDLKQDADQRARRKLWQLLHFDPMPEVGRAVFIAAPQRGTAAANGMLASVVRRLVGLPKSLVNRFSDVLDITSDLPNRLPTSMDNLRESDPFIQAAADLPISTKLPYHSVIARRSNKGEVALSDDGFVAYASAHMEGAISEKVIFSGHSVQETPAAILEIRRILREDANSIGRVRSIKN